MLLFLLLYVFDSVQVLRVVVEKSDGQLRADDLAVNFKTYKFLYIAYVVSYTLVVVTGPSGHD